MKVLPTVEKDCGVKNAFFFFLQHSFSSGLSPTANLLPTVSPFPDILVAYKVMRGSEQSSQEGRLALTLTSWQVYNVLMSEAANLEISSKKEKKSLKLRSLIKKNKQTHCDNINQEQW